MAIYRMTRCGIERLNETTFAASGFQERADLQRLLRANIGVIAPDVMVIAEEFCDWDDSRRRIDLLAVDRDANLVVIELKRDTDGGHMELQAIRYAAFVAEMTFAKAVEVFQEYLSRTGSDLDPQSALLEFLRWDRPRDDDFAEDCRIILVSADFSREITTSVLWLNERDLNIRCVRMKPYDSNGSVLIDVQQVVPLPEAEEYQIRVREKAISRRDAAREAGAPTGYWFMNVGDAVADNRSWDDCNRYGYMTAGGGPQWINLIRKLRKGDKLFAYATGAGFVGLGEVLTEAIPQKDFVPPGQSSRLVDLPLRAKLKVDSLDDPDRCEWCAGVRWVATLPREKGVLKHRALRSTLQQIRQQDLVDELLTCFDPTRKQA